MFTLWSELRDDVGIVSYRDKTETLIGVMSSRNAVRDLCSKKVQSINPIVIQTQRFLVTDARSE